MRSAGRRQPYILFTPGEHLCWSLSDDVTATVPRVPPLSIAEDGTDGIERVPDRLASLGEPSASRPGPAEDGPLPGSHPRNRLPRTSPPWPRAIP